MIYGKLLAAGSLGATAFLATLSTTASTPELAAIEKMLPSGEGTFLMFLMTTMTYLIKNGSPVRKDVDDQFGALKDHHGQLFATQRTMLERIEDLAFDTRSHRESTASFREDLAEKLGGMDATLKQIDKRQEYIEGRVMNLEKKIGPTGEWQKPRL